MLRSTPQINKTEPPLPVLNGQSGLRRPAISGDTRKHIVRDVGWIAGLQLLLMVLFPVIARLPRHLTLPISPAGFWGVVGLITLPVFLFCAGRNRQRYANRTVRLVTSTAIATFLSSTIQFVLNGLLGSYATLQSAIITTSIFFGANFLVATAALLVSFIIYPATKVQQTQ